MIVEKRLKGNIVTNSNHLVVNNTSDRFRMSGSMLVGAPTGSIKWGGIGGDIDDQEDLRLVLRTKINEEDLHALTNLELENLLK